VFRSLCASLLAAIARADSQIDVQSSSPSLCTRPAMQSRQAQKVGGKVAVGHASVLRRDVYPNTWFRQVSKWLRAGCSCV
jgi:hypothetical protein